MRTVDSLSVTANPERVFALACGVEHWPDHLAHYRWVRFLEGDARTGIVEMAAWRPFGLFRWPTWWVSEMRTDPHALDVHYTHIRGITTGMRVVWQVRPGGNGTNVTLVHEWDGPRWPLIRKPAAEWIIGPVFVHGIASRTLAGLGRVAEQRDE